MIITSFRLAWIYSDWPSERPLAVDGVLDLRDTSLNRPILLEGEWTFYPGRFLLRENPDSPRTGGVSLTLPGSWKGQLADPEQTTGYGSYQLFIQFEAPGEKRLAIAMPSTATSSELYVDGVKLGAAGVPGTTADETDAFEGPYNVVFWTDKSEIEIVIHAANFGNLVQGGLLNSIQFGTENVVMGHKQFSMSMQLLVCVFLLIHVVYALILYIMGARYRALLSLALMMISAALSVLVTDDKLLLAWLKLPYSVSLKLNILSYIWVAALLILCVHQLYPKLQKRPWHMYYGAIVLGVTIVVILLPSTYASIVDLYTIPIMLAGFLYVPVLTLRATLRFDGDAIFLWLVFVSSAINLSWGLMYNFNYGLRSIHFYPVDFIVMFLAFASYWFRLYFRNLQQTAQLASELQKADKQKNDFLANTSHELRNPLHGMINIARSVLEEQAVRPAGRERLELLVRVGKRMSLLLNDLMDLDRLQAKGLRLQPKAIQAQAATAGVIDMMDFMLEGKPLELRNEIPESFPPVLADENRLVQILFNLIHNAVKFTAQGHITIRAAVQEKLAVLEVEDTGIGIEPEAQQRLFEPYEQADSSITALGGGIGLGLSISRQLAELHGGTLEVQSGPGQGSIFRLTLPLASEAAPPAPLPAPGENDWKGAAKQTAAEAASDSESSDAVLEARTIRPRVLVVDDDPVNLRILEGMLPKQRYEVTAVYSGHDAMKLIDEEEWDLVVSDVMMPRMSGYELTQTIRLRFSMSELPVLLLTARSQPEDIAAGFLAGANDYVTKPADSLELQHRVRALTELKLSAGERLRMEAAWLQAQVQPHFLFNTLNSIAALSQIDIGRMRSLLDVFGKYLRASFDFRNSERVVPLMQELSLVKAYLFIEQERFGNRLHVQWEVPDRLLSAPLPPLSIQTLVENAVHHGVLRRIEGGTVHIAAEERSHHIEIRVSDDGIGMEDHILKQVLEDMSGESPGIGLRNTDRRLRQIYGRGLSISSAPCQGTTITFRAGKP
ncbi:ATP-binding protein [Paenibacillus sp. y28]